jgi:hypothetical protein
MPNVVLLERPDDLCILCFLNDAFLHEVFFALRKEIEIAKIANDNVLLIEGYPVASSMTYVNDNPGYRMELIYFNTQGLPVAFMLNWRALAQSIQWIYRFHTEQRIPFKCSGSVGLQQLESIFKQPIVHISHNWRNNEKFKE